ncbi:uncharacterized protein KY384_002180 [Bacidia gigantensis]|uniref:uncharacterized protein n=1 Tax=Bacidia gigantensis TaxID=2732470 RepID=UPI001D042F1C|nr:uncharacterized protein KY384_002180 [Bacidia gigantensis]KAG8533397.1 hypothetical protein KY384_002180 [Bacidia gigantensis]
MSILFSASWRPFGHNLAGQQWSRASLREFKATCSPLHSVQSSLLRWRHSPRNNAESHLILLWPTSRTAFENHWFRALRPSHTAAATQIETSQHATSVLPKPDVKTAFALPARRVNSIFRGSLPAGDGNGLLAKLQIHRQKGTLDAKFDASEEAIEAGLRYLRSRYPMDEDAAVLARVDQELENEIRLPQEKPELSPYAESNLVKIRQENKARHEREAALEVAQAKRLEDTDKKRRQLVAVASADRSVTDPKTKESTGLRPLEEPNRKEAEWVTRYREEAEQTEIPDISTFRRLWPSGVFTVAAVTLSYLFAQNYTPPEKAARIFSESPPAAVTMYAILAANVLVYAAWKTPQLWVALSKFFIIVPLRPKAPSMILAAFSHQDFIHLAQNMFFMWFIGVRCKF